MTPNSKQSLGPYDLTTPIGAGGMGEVFRARDTRLNREVAIKVLPKDSPTDADRLSLYDDYDRTPELLNAAQAAARNALSLAPSSVSARLAQASVYALQKATYSQPLDMLRRLERDAPNDPDVLVTLGWRLLFSAESRAAMSGTNNAEALKLFDRALALRPGDPML
jgi:serine/threonine protein kinase